MMNQKISDRYQMDIPIDQIASLLTALFSLCSHIHQVASFDESRFFAIICPGSVRRIYVRRQSTHTDHAEIHATLLAINIILKKFTAIFRCIDRQNF